MPRLPSHVHPLRNLREKLGMTQPEFGQLLDVSAETIKSVENGRLELSPRLAEAIAEQTDLDLLSVTWIWQQRENSGDGLEDFLKKNFKMVLEEEQRLEEYTKEKFESRRKRRRAVDMSAEELMEEIRPRLLAAHHIASFGRRGIERLKREVLRAIMRTTREIWNETISPVLPDDLPDEK